MKKIYTIIACGLMLAATSCKGFLDKTPYDVVDPDEGVTNEVAQALTTGCYVTLQSSNMYGFRVATLDIVAGNSVVGAGGGTDGLETTQVANFTTLADNALAMYMWRSPWVGIGHCNDAISSVKANINTLSETVANQCLGEAYFLRGHYYFLLARLYGGLPLRTAPYEPGTSTAIARESLEDTYKLIIEDTKAAIDLLPSKYEYSSENMGRACKEAALIQLANVYLVLADKDNSYYQNVVDLCDELAGMGYDVESYDYANNFDARVNNGPESLFEVQYSGDTDYDFWGKTPQCCWLSTFMGPRNSNLVAGSYGWNLPTEEFMSIYEPGDKRKDVTVFYAGCPKFDGVDYKPSWSNTGYNVRKFCVSKNISPEYNTNPANVVVYRYAEAVLFKAEALNEMGNTVEAANELNKVRRRAGLADVPGTLSKDEMRETIIHERRVELAFEGKRWFDIIRIDGGQYALRFLASIGKVNVDQHNLLLPIPQVEMDANPLMTQNPGY